LFPFTLYSELLKDFLPAVANAQQKPTDKATVQKVIPPADAALSALNSVLAASSVPSDDRIYYACLFNYYIIFL
jgi:hypothetical protein